MDRTRAVMGLLDPQAEPAYTPAAFFIHFDAAHQRGQAAVDRHLEYFHHTGMDLVKVQYEDRFPLRPEIVEPGDWGGMPVYGIDFYANALEILAGILDAAPDDALVVQTLYSPFMQASTTVGRGRLREHIRADPGAVAAGMERITESVMGYVRECIALGVDGFYASTQGADRSMFAGSPLFDRCIRPFDLALMEEVHRRCRFNILHVCDYHGGYDDLAAFAGYPGHVVSLPGSVERGGEAWAREGAVFARPLMGGLDRHGIIASGTPEQIVAAVERVLVAGPPRFFLGADCTLPGDVSWDNVRLAVETAHARR